MKQLGLPEDQAEHIRELEKAAPAKFQKGRRRLLPKLGRPQADLGPPGDLSRSACPADQTVAVPTS